MIVGVPLVTLSVKACITTALFAEAACVAVIVTVPTATPVIIPLEASIIALLMSLLV